MSTTSEIEIVRTTTDDSELPPRVFDVSDLDPAAVTEYAAESTADCHFERKGGRTYLYAQ